MEKDKVDKGFEIFYNKLSYRRKFIRTIWLIPVGIITGILITYISIFASFFYWLSFLINAVRKLKYNYIMWKKENNK